MCGLDPEFSQIVYSIQGNGNPEKWGSATVITGGKTLSVLLHFQFILIVSLPPSSPHYPFAAILHTMSNITKHT